MAELLRRLEGQSGPAVDDLRSVADHLLRRSVWIVGGDGWAYDIGSGGLDHVLATGRDVNVLVMDTEVYSNTGGQSSKSTPIGAVAKFAAAGKTMNKKDIALQAIAYGNVYVARVAMGADPHQTLTAFREAEAYDGPSLIIAYSHCIAHGYDLRKGLDQQYKAVASGHWPLVRYDPTVRARGGNPFQLDSPRPRIPLEDYIYNELRYKVLRNRDPAEADRLLVLAQEAVNQRWKTYEEMATRGAQRFPADARVRDADTGAPAGDAARRAQHRRRPGGEGGATMTSDTLSGNGSGPTVGVRPGVDLTTTYLGLSLRNPLVASPSPATSTVDRIKALADAGVGAVVLPSLYEEQVIAEELREIGFTEPYEDVHGEAQGYFPVVPGTQLPGATWRYLRLVEEAVAAVDIPVIASLNGSSLGGWTDFARRMEAAGAAALELNIYFVPGDPHTSGRAVEDRHVEILRQVKAAVSIPVAVKLSPHFSSTGEMARAAGRRRRRRARALQPLPAPGRRPGDPRRHPGRRVVHAGGSAAGPLVDRHPQRAGARLAGRDDRCRERRRRGGLPARRSRRRHDRLRPAAARARARGGADRRPHRVAEAQAVRLGR